MPDRVRWFSNEAGGSSTILRPGIAVSPAEYNWLKKQAAAERQSIATVLYHLTKRAIDEEMQRQGEWAE